MKIFLPVLLGAVVLTGCGGGGNNNSSDLQLPPIDPPVVNPPPVDPPPQLQSFAGFTRSVLADGENAAPREVNDVDFNQDAADDDFEDLLQ